MKKVKTNLPHQIPSDLKKEIYSDLKSKYTWEDITPLARNEFICFVISAKKSETRVRRISIVKSKLSKGERRPCCFAGCPHRIMNLHLLI